MNKLEYMKKLKDSHYGGKEKCHICKGNNEGYMLQKELWERVCETTSSPQNTLICIKCSHNALKRNFTYDDFIDCPLNLGVFGFDIFKFIPLQEEYYKL